MSLRAYIATFFLLTVVGLVPIVAVNIVVDPTAVFGSGVYPPVVWTARQSKLELFQALQTPPKTVVLGSSRAMKLPTEAVERHFGGPVFNFAVNSARTEDYLGIYDYVCAEGARPDVILIGVDVEAFHNGIPPDDRLVAVPEFSRTLALPRLWASRLKAIAESTSFSHLWLSSKAVLEPRKERKSKFDPAGFLTYEDWERKIARGTHDLASEVERSKDEYLRRYAGFTGLAGWRVDALRRLVDRASHDGVRVVLYITPLHPQVLETLRRERNYSELRSDVSELLMGLSDGENVCAFDSGDLSTFGGDPGLFYDGAHPREENNRRLLNTLVQEGNCAVQ